MQTISMFDANDFVSTVTIDDEQYKLHFGWNDSGEFWSVDVRDSANVDIVRGVAVVANFPLLNQYRREVLPKGDLFAVSVNPYENKTIGRQSFLDGSFTLVYASRGEIDNVTKLVEKTIQSALS